tara:strand:+ start:1118 stop:1600 length:483 start_codon:yes stop_codon:yes gene_type:complete
MSTFDFETNFEKAAKIFLEDATGIPSTSIFSSLDQDQFLIPRLQISAVVGGATDPPTLNNLNDLEYSQYDINLSISIVTDASIDGTHTDHRLYRAQVREAMLLNADNWTTLAVGGGTVLPLYQVKYQRPSGTDYEIDGMLAVSTLNYELKFTVNNAAPTL